MGDTVRMTTISQYPPIVRYDDVVVEAEDSPSNIKIVNDYSERLSRHGRQLSPHLSQGGLRDRIGSRRSLQEDPSDYLEREKFKK